MDQNAGEKKQNALYVVDKMRKRLFSGLLGAASLKPRLFADAAHVCLPAAGTAAAAVVGKALVSAPRAGAPHYFCPLLLLSPRPVFL